METRRRNPLRLAAGIAACWFAAAAAPSPAPAQEHIPGTDPEHPKVRYADGSVSENDRCIVRKTKLNPNNRPVYVNGRAIGFC